VLKPKEQSVDLNEILKKQNMREKYHYENINNLEKSIETERAKHSPSIPNPDVFNMSFTHQFATSDNRAGSKMISPSSLVSNIPPWDKTYDNTRAPNQSILSEREKISKSIVMKKNSNDRLPSPPR